MDKLVTGGGVAGIILAATYLGRLGLDWLRERRKAPLDSDHAHIGNAAATNAILLESLKGLQGENARLQQRVRDLEAEDERKNAKITELEQRLSAIADELAALKGH